MNNEYLGRCLLDEGFEVWFRYMFRVIEGRPFIVEPIHQGLFEHFNKIYAGELTRLNVNVPPRTGKTTLAKYLLVFSLTVNPKSNIIYTSFSQSLLADIALSVRNILEHPIYKAMYSSYTSLESQEVNPIDDFWLEYIKSETGKNTYSTKKIITRYGGVCLFSSIGSQLTGYGAGQRSSDSFGGALIIDDANKPADIRSQVMRSKVERYFEETLLSRLNNSDVPIINIQQRLHLEDLSGILEKKYGFKTLKRPLIDKTGKCLLPSQYTPDRIKELQINNYMFVSQYQQEPIILGGAVIRREWFKFYDVSKEYKYKKIIIAADTAMTVKENSDFTCFIVGGVTETNHLHILQILHGRYEYPELKRQAINLYNAWQRTDRTSASAFYIEDRASGIQLIQDFRASALPVISVEVTKDKLARVEEILEYLANGFVMLPDSELYGNNPEFLAECEAFTRDMSHSKDDMVDSLVHLVNNTIAKRKVSILEVL